MLRPILHIALHFVVPAAAAGIGWRDHFWRAWAVMAGTILIDLDHLLADPIYDPDRCSIGTHPLHSVWAIALYVLLLVPKQTRLVGVGLVVHVALDTMDCMLT
ncbi:MAG: DUF6122 family protein [Planctomycetota bacterium]